MSDKDFQLVIKRQFNVIAFGNPLLDEVVNVSSQEEDFIINKHHLQRYVGQEANTQLLELDIQEKTKELVPGGCALNTCRVLRWLNPDKNIIINFYGSVGNDSRKDHLEEIVEKDGIQSRFSIHPRLPTGHCIALVCGQERTLIAELGAANVFTSTDYDRMKINQQMNKADVCYVTSFFAVHSWEVTHLVANKCSASGITLAFNLNGEYLWQDSKFLMELNKLLPKVRVLFGNKNEFRTLIKTANDFKLENPILKGIATILQDNDKKSRSMSNECSNEICTVIISDGPDPILSCKIDIKTGIIYNYLKTKVNPMSSNEIIDTIGAGDSFVAGFLQAYVLLGNSTRKCIERGIYASQEIIRQIGTNLPEYPPSKIQYQKKINI